MSKKAVDRPFAPNLLARAKAIAGQYQVILNCEEGRWYGRGLEMPRVFGDGATPAKCVADTREALTGAVALLLEQGRKPPGAAREGTRTRQVNVRLTAEEAVLLKAAAGRKGFSGMSDFVRAAAIEAAR